MIYDYINIIEFYRGLPPTLDTALDLVAAVQTPIAKGTFHLDYGVKAIVGESITKERNPKEYEAHLNFADIQFALEGSEYLFSNPCWCVLSPTTTTNASTADSTPKLRTPTSISASVPGTSPFSSTTTATCPVWGR